MVLYIVGAINLLFGRHLCCLFPGLLTIAVVGLQHRLVHRDSELETILFSTTTLCTIHSCKVWVSAVTGRTPVSAISNAFSHAIPTRTYSMNLLLGQALHDPKDTILFPSWSSLSKRVWMDVKSPIGTRYSSISNCWRIGVRSEYHGSTKRIRYTTLLLPVRSTLCVVQNAACKMPRLHTETIFLQHCQHCLDYCCKL